jgi:zinc protease
MRRWIALMAGLFLMSGGVMGCASDTNRGVTGSGMSKVAAKQKPKGAIVPHVFVTDNGMQVWMVCRSSVPFVVFKWIFDAGAVRDSQGKEGLANLVSSMLTEGTSTRTAKQISEESDFIGADLGAHCGKDYASVTLTVLKSQLEKGFDLAADVLQNASFEEGEFKRVKAEIEGDILKDEEDPGTVASKAFNELLFKGMPYHHPVKGYRESVSSISRDEALEFYKHYYRPNNAIMVVVGDITEDELKGLIDARLSQWSKGEVAPPATPPTPHSEEGVKEIKKDVTQANIVMGHLGISRSNPDFVPLYLFNQILGGGGLTSRLFKKIREEGGYSYSVYSYIEPTRWPGAFQIVLQTKNSSAQEAIAKVKEVLKDLLANGPSEQEVEDAKRYLTGSFPLRIDTNSEIASYLGFAAFHKLGTDYLVRFPHMIEAVSREEMMEAARRHIHPDHLLVVVVKGEHDLPGGPPPTNVRKDF